MGLSTASLYLKIAVVFSILATVCHVIGFATDSWKTVSTGHYGLWAGCTLSICGRFTTDDSSFLAVRAMATIGLILLGGVTIVGILFLCVDSLRRRSCRSFLILGSFLAVVAIVIAVVIYGVQFLGDPSNGGYSLAFTIIGGILALVAGILYVLDRPRVTHTVG